MKIKEAFNRIVKGMDANRNAGLLGVDTAIQVINRYHLLSLDDTGCECRIEKDKWFCLYFFEESTDVDGMTMNDIHHDQNKVEDTELIYDTKWNDEYERHVQVFDSVVVNGSYSNQHGTWTERFENSDIKTLVIADVNWDVDDKPLAVFQF